MIINTQSWHYTLYKSTYTGFGSQPPLVTNLCQYMRRLMFSPLLYLGILSLWIMALFIIAPFGLMLGQYPKFLSSEERRGIAVFDLQPYNVPTLFGHQIHPWKVLLPLVLIGVNVFAFSNHHFQVMLVEIVLAAAAFFLGFVIICTDSETDRLLMAWVSAKTQRFCPKVEFSTTKPTDKQP